LDPHLLECARSCSNRIKMSEVERGDQALHGKTSFALGLFLHVSRRLADSMTGVAVSQSPLCIAFAPSLRMRCSSSDHRGNHTHERQGLRWPRERRRPRRRANEVPMACRSRHHHWLSHSPCRRGRRRSREACRTGHHWRRGRRLPTARSSPPHAPPSGIDVFLPCGCPLDGCHKRSIACGWRVRSTDQAVVVLAHPPATV
jgi:hypothetical protein